MRHIPGWVVGSVGTAAIVASFYAGGVRGARDLSTGATAAADTSALASPAADLQALAVECEAGQRALVHPATTATAAWVSCVNGETRLAPAAGATGRIASGAGASPALSGTPSPTDEPIAVYRPRATPVSYEPTPPRYERATSREPSREVAPPVRSATKSAVIIASSTAVGAAVGGLAKGTKGALIGGILGGGAATVWDQVTRRRDDDQ